MLLTCKTPQEQEHHNLNRKTNPVTQQHNTINRPLQSRESEKLPITSNLIEQVLESSRREIEGSQAIIANVIGVLGIVRTDLDLIRLVGGIELVRSNGMVG